MRAMEEISRRGLGKDYHQSTHGTVLDGVTRACVRINQKLCNYSAEGSWYQEVGREAMKS